MPDVWCRICQKNVAKANFAVSQAEVISMHYSIVHPSIGGGKAMTDALEAAREDQWAAARRVVSDDHPTDCPCIRDHLEVSFIHGMEYMNERAYAAAIRASERERYAPFIEAAKRVAREVSYGREGVTGMHTVKVAHVDVESLQAFYAALAALKEIKNA